MGKYKVKGLKKEISKLDKFDNKVNAFIDTIIPAIIISIPIIFVLYILNIHGYFFPKGTVLFKLNYFYQFLMYILAIIYFYKLFVHKVSITKSDILLFIFMILTVLSTLFAVDKYIALNGYPNRYEGMYTLLFYCFLYLDCRLLSKDTDVKYLIRMMLLIVIIHFIFVLLQLTGLYQSVVYMYKSGDAIGLTENCNFLGSLMCLLSVISVTNFMLCEEKKNIEFNFVIFVIAYCTLLFANSSGPFLSFILSIFILIVVLFKKRIFNLKKFIFVLMSIVILYPICLFKNDEITPELKSNFNSVVNIIFSKNNDSNIDVDQNDNEQVIRDLGHGRIRIWSNVWKLIERKPLLGYGPDNLGLVYEKSSDDSKIADKAHNIYLHIGVSSGLLAMISYILWIIYTIILGLKSDNNTILGLCMGVIAYSIQGFFNINVLEVTPYFYITIGLMMFLVNEKKFI